MGVPEFAGFRLRLDLMGVPDFVPEFAGFRLRLDLMGVPDFAGFRRFDGCPGFRLRIS